MQKGYTIASPGPELAPPSLHLPFPVALVTDVVSAGAIIGTIFGVLPFVAAFAGMIWYGIQIWESRTVQHWWRNRQMIRKAKKIARLRAKEKVIVAQLEALELVRSAKVEARTKVEVAKVEAAKLEVHEATEIVEKS
jgi:hypothetical protein